MKKILLIITGIAGGIIIAAVVSFLVFLQSFKKLLEIKVDPALYSGIVAKRLEYSGKYEFLPKEIPQDAQKIAFFHLPGFLQGADIIALRLTLPEHRIKKIIDELETSERQKIKNFGKVPEPYAYPSYGMKKPPSNNIFESMTYIPPDFQIFLYKCSIEDIEKNWNHNFMAFTAVSLDKNEVLYYTSEW